MFNDKMAILDALNARVLANEPHARLERFTHIIKLTRKRHVCHAVDIHTVAPMLKTADCIARPVQTHDS